MSTKRTPAHLDREIASALSRGNRHATKSGSVDARQQFIEAFLALQHAFEAADEVAAKAHNQAVRAGYAPNAPTLVKMKAAANRMEKALRTYSGEVDELLGKLDY